jgi:hypothetical protein
VSNSSSASFIIPKQVLSEEQLDKLLSYNVYTNDKYLDSWNISLIESYTSQTKYIKGYTIMDNGDMAEFLEDIGVDSIYVVDIH